MLDWVRRTSLGLAYFLRMMSVVLVVTIYASVTDSHAPLTTIQVNLLIFAWIALWFGVEVVYANTKKPKDRS